MIENERFSSLDLNGLFTVKHASLNLDDFLIPEDFIINISPSALRKTMKIAGIIEKTLILESFISFSLYFSKRYEFHLTDFFISTLKKLETASQESIKSYFNNETIKLADIDFTELKNLTSELLTFLQNQKNTSYADKYRIKDFEFISKMLIRFGS